MHDVRRAQNRLDAGGRPGGGMQPQVRVRGWCETIGEWIGEKIGVGCNYVKEWTVQGFKSVTGWLFSMHGMGVLCFVFALFGTLFHTFDSILVENGTTFYLYTPFHCPLIICVVTFIFAMKTQQEPIVPQTLILIGFTGVIAGTLIEEQMDTVKHAKLTNDDFIFGIGFACAFFSLGIYVLDYKWTESIRGVLMRAVLMAIVWFFVLYKLFPPLPSLPIQLGLYLSFTLAVGIIEYCVNTARSLVPYGYFPNPYIGYLVQGFAMIALSTYYTSLRLSDFSESWISCDWMVKAGPIICGYVLGFHFFYWICEKICGPGMRVGFFALSALVVVIGVVFTALQFGFNDPFLKWKFL